MFLVGLYFIAAVLSAFVQPNISVKLRQTRSDNQTSIPLCGLVKVEATDDVITFRADRIAGGFYARPGQYPAFVGLRFRMHDQSYGHCSGVLISDRFVLTAAHCLADVLTAFLLFVAPTHHHQYHWDQYNVSKIRAEKMCKSKKFAHVGEGKDKTLVYDYGIIKLSEAVELSDEVQTACFPSEPVEMGQDAYAIGVGVLDVNYDPESNKPIKTETDRLRVLPVERVPCQEEHETRICFKANRLLTFRGDTCVGDSGGPILIKSKGRMQVVGITSYGSKICRDGKVGVSVNADVFSHLNHITELIDECNQ